MKAQNLAALIDHVATSVRTGRMSLKLYSELSTDLWQLATDLDLRKEVDKILQNISEEEMTVAIVQTYQEKEAWVIRGNDGPVPVFWNPKRGWVRTPYEAKKYVTQTSAKKALEWYHGRRFQKDNVDVIRVCE